MARTKYYRVAVEGPTVDGREIERKHLEQMAASYDPATYTARINCEHLRGYSPNPPFNAYGSIAALKTEEITLSLGGKDVKKLALYASFEVNDQAKELTANNQKIFSSVEIQPDFAGTGKAYLVGIALTDSPASLATEALKFSTREEKRKSHLLGVEDTGFAIEFTDDSDAELAATSSFLKKLFAQILPQAPAVAPETVVTPPTQSGSGDKPDQFAALAGAMEQGFSKLAETISATTAKQDARIAKIAADVSALSAEQEIKPARSYSARPTATGGGDRILADC